MLLQKVSASMLLYSLPRKCYRASVCNQSILFPDQVNNIKSFGAEFASGEISTIFILFLNMKQ